MASHSDDDCIITETEGLPAVTIKTNTTKTRAHPQSSFQCSYCEEKFQVNFDRIKHLRYYHPEVPLFQCEICSKDFKWMHALRNHMKTIHAGQVKHLCKKCNKGFKHLSGLRIHALSHEGRQKKAETCDSFADYAKELNNSLSLTCSVCNKVYKSMRSYVKHMLIHEASSKRRTLTCLFCKEVFDNCESMQSHECRQLENKKSFICGICNASYHLETNLERHIATHTGMNYDGIHLLETL